MANHPFCCASEKNVFQATVAPRREDDEICFELVSELDNFLERSPRNHVAIVWPKPHIMFLLYLSEPVLHQSNRIDAIEHQMSGLRDFRERIRGLDMNQMNGRFELFRQRDRVIKCLHRSARKIQGQENGADPKRLLPLYWR